MKLLYIVLENNTKQEYTGGGVDETRLGYELKWLNLCDESMGIHYDYFGICYFGNFPEIKIRKI